MAERRADTRLSHTSISVFAAKREDLTTRSPTLAYIPALTNEMQVVQNCFQLLPMKRDDEGEITSCQLCRTLKIPISNLKHRTSNKIMQIYNSSLAQRDASARLPCAVTHIHPPCKKSEKHIQVALLRSRSIERLESLWWFCKVVSCAGAKTHWEWCNINLWMEFSKEIQPLPMTSTLWFFFISFSAQSVTQFWDFPLLGVSILPRFAQSRRLIWFFSHKQTQWFCCRFTRRVCFGMTPGHLVGLQQGTVNHALQSTKCHDGLPS